MIRSLYIMVYPAAHRGSILFTHSLYNIKLRYTRPTNCRDLGGPPIVPRLSGILQTDSAALFKIGAKKF